MTTGRVPRTAAALALAVALTAAAPARAQTSAPNAEVLYLDALRATLATPVPPLIVFKEDFTGRNLHPVCATKDEGGEFDLDGGGGRNAATYEMTYYANERIGTAENVRTHERCKGTGLLAPASSAAATATPASHRRSSSLDDTVGNTLRDERATYVVTYAGEQIVDGVPAWRLRLLPRGTSGDEAMEKAILVDQRSSRIREIWVRYGEMVWAGGAHVDVDAHFAAVEQYWLVTNWSLNVNARALVVPLHFAFAGRAYDFNFGSHRQASQAAGGG